MKRAHQKRQTLRRFLLMGTFPVLISLCMCFNVSAIPRPQVNVEPASVFVDFSSIELSVGMLNGGNSFVSDGEVTRTSTNFFNAVPPSVMRQVPNRDLYYQRDFITITQYTAVGIATGEVYADSVYITFDVPLVLNDGEYVQFWIRVAEIGFYNLNGVLIDQSDYVAGAMYAAVYFYEDITSETSSNGNQWQCLQYGPSYGTTSLDGILLSLNGNGALPYDTYQVICRLEFGAVAFGSAIVGDNGDATDDYYDYLDIQQILLQQGINIGNNLIGFLTGQDGPYDPTQWGDIPRFDVDSLINNDAALEQADDALDSFLDDIDTGQVSNCVDFIQYAFNQLFQFGEVALLTGGTIVITIFRAVMGR